MCLWLFSGVGPAVKAQAVPVVGAVVESLVGSDVGAGAEKG